MCCCRVARERRSDRWKTRGAILRVKSFPSASAISLGRFIPALIVLGVLAFATPAVAERHELDFDLDTEEGNFLVTSLDEEITKRIPLFEQFVKEHPKHASTAWVLEQLQEFYMQTNQPDKAIDAGERLLVADPEDLDAAMINVKIAESKKDPALVAKWKERISILSAKVLVTASDTQQISKFEDAGIERVELAAQVQESQDVALYNKAVAETDPHRRIALLNALSKRNPSADLAHRIQLFYYVCYRDTHEFGKALAIAEKILTYDQSREDILFFVADKYFRQKREHEKVMAYCAKIASLMRTKSKPAYMSEADWANQKSILLQQASYIPGVIHMNLGRFAEADRFLRATLPYARGNARLTANILNCLGWANYKMKIPLQAIQFYQECAVIPSPYQEQAKNSVVAIKSEFGLPQ
jgi:tetratricopeptide (TPR) repeat protein